MGPRTRSSAHNSPVKQAATSTAQSTTDSASLPKLFILPKERSPDARFVLLPNPRDGSLGRYFFDPHLGPYEFTKVSTSSLDLRSVLFTNGGDHDVDAPVPPQGSLAEGYVLKSPELFVATPIDAFFLALPLFHPQEKDSRRLLQSIDDLLDAFEGKRGHLRYTFTNSKYRSALKKRLECICDSVEAGDEAMFRLNEEKLAKELFVKAQRMVAQELPPSLEERFVTRVLEPPITSIHREETTTSLVSETPTTEDLPESQSTATQSSFAPGASTAVSETSSTTTVVETLPTYVKRTTQSNEAPASMTHLLRLRTALNFIISSYLSPSLSSAIQAHLTSLIDFSPLDAHLEHLSSLRASALATRSLTDFSRKRGSEEFDEEAAMNRAEKKRRLEEEEKRKKAGESKGVRDLKKVDISGMKKMSDFFGKKPAAAKAKAKT